MFHLQPVFWTWQPLWHQTPRHIKIATFFEVCGCPWKKSLPQAVGCCYAVVKVFQHKRCLCTCLSTIRILSETQYFLNVVMCHLNEEKKNTRYGQLSYDSSLHYSRNDDEQVTRLIFMDGVFSRQPERTCLLNWHRLTPHTYTDRENGIQGEERGVRQKDKNTGEDTIYCTTTIAQPIYKRHVTLCS